MRQVHSYAEVLKAHDDVKAAAARSLGMNPTNFNRALKAEARRGGKPAVQAGLIADVKEASLPEFPDPDAPISELLKLRKKDFSRRKSRRDAEQWFPIHIHDDKPIGIWCFGDPHIDDDGCNIDLVERHAVTVAKTPGLYGLNIGDTTNNWSGRLARLWASQSMDKRTARRFAKWFLAEAGIPWIVWLMGNHDEWAEGEDILRLMNTHAKLPMLSWQARFQIVFKGGSAFRIHAAHDFPGHSMWNNTHGPLKAASMGGDADLYVCGHKHNAGIQQFVNAREKWVTVCRAAGYKRLDDYAARLGHNDAPDDGSGVFIILDPHAQGSARLTAFASMEMGCAVLKALRKGK